MGLCCAVNSLRDQLDDMKRKNQNSHISNEKNIHLQKQVSRFKSATTPEAFNDSQTEKKKKGAGEPTGSAICLFLSPPPRRRLAGGGQRAAPGRVGGGDEAPQNPDGEQQAAAAAGGQRPRAAGQVLRAGAQQAEPGEGVHQPAGGAGDGAERAQPGLGDHQRPDGWVAPSVQSGGFRGAVNNGLIARVSAQKEKCFVIYFHSHAGADVAVSSASLW